MKTALRLLLTLVVFLPVRLFAGKYEQPKPIVTPAELAAAAADVPVMRLDFTLPEEKNAPESSAALSKRFFNTPEEMRYGGVTSVDWRKKWDLFAKALVDKAAHNKLDADSLKKCLSVLNRGRNKETAACVGFVTPFRPWPPPGASTEQLKAYEKAVEADEKETAEKNAEIQKEIEAHPERYYDETLAVIPCGAYLAKSPNGDCWIIVCKWENFSEKQPEVGLGHIMVWAMDAKTSAVVAYVTCD